MKGVSARSCSRRSRPGCWFSRSPRAPATTTTRGRRTLHPLGHIEEPAVLGGFGGANPDIQTDIAFWGKYAFQGNWDGFNIRNIAGPGKPKQVSRTFCDGNQGDVVVWDASCPLVEHAGRNAGGLRSGLEL